jgi:AbrB family looped-hinge helix DNA binding protein
MSEVEYREEVYLGAQGRLVIPARLRRQLGLREGDALIARSEQGRLVVEKPDTTKQRLRDRYSRATKGRSLAQELLAERRKEARRERRE